MSTSPVYAQLHGFFLHLLPSMTNEDWAMVESVLSVRELRKGDHFLRPGQVSNYVSFINHGLVRAYYILDGREYVISFHDLEDCRYFSPYESFLTRQPTKLHFEAMEDTQAVDMHYDDLQMLYDKVPGADRIGRFMAERLYLILSERTASFMLETPEQRYVKLLERRPSLFQKVPQYMIASYLGITPEALSRIRARLSRKAERELIDQDQ